MSRPPYWVQPMLRPEEADAVAEALRASQLHELAAKVARAGDTARRQHEAATAADDALAAYRATRAKDHVLSKRQAECLASVRAGQGPFYQYEPSWGWRRSRNMGGAVNRMVAALIEEGLLTPRRELTDGGRARLEAWEAKHGNIAGSAP